MKAWFCFQESEDLRGVHGEPNAQEALGYSRVNVLPPSSIVVLRDPSPVPRQHCQVQLAPGQGSRQGLRGTQRQPHHHHHTNPDHRACLF